MDEGSGAVRDGGLARSRRGGRAPALPMMGVNMASMIDVVFLLLVYFMLIAAFRANEESLPIEVPRVGVGVAERDPFALPARPVRITVLSHGDGAGEYTLASDSELLRETGSYAELLREASSRRGSVFAAEQRWVIAAAGETRWEHTLGVFNALRRAGYVRITFAEPLP